MKYVSEGDSWHTGKQTDREEAGKKKHWGTQTERVHYDFDQRSRVLQQQQSLFGTFNVKGSRLGYTAVNSNLRQPYTAWSVVIDIINLLNRSQGLPAIVNEYLSSSPFTIRVRDCGDRSDYTGQAKGKGQESGAAATGFVRVRWYCGHTNEKDYRDMCTARERESFLNKVSTIIKEKNYHLADFASGLYSEFYPE